MFFRHFRLGEELRRVTQMQHADDIVDVVAKERHARVCGGSNLPDDLVDRRFDVDARHLRPGHHDVIDRDFVEVEDAQHHVLVLGLDLGALVHDRAQFLLAEMIFCGMLRAEAEHQQNPVGHTVDDSDDWVPDPAKEVEDVRGRQRNLLRMRGRNRLGRNLREDQEDDRAGHGRDGNADIAKETNRQRRRQRCC